jgi:hypothetical protein
MKELLDILKEQPELKKQLNSQSGYEIKTLIIQAYPQLGSVTFPFTSRKWEVFIKIHFFKFLVRFIV